MRGGRNKRRIFLTDGNSRDIVQLILQWNSKYELKYINFDPLKYDRNYIGAPNWMMSSVDNIFGHSRTVSKDEGL